MKKSYSGLSRVLKIYGISLISGATVCAVFLLIFSVVLTSLDIPHSLSTLMSTVSLAIGALTCGGIASFLQGKNGLLSGLVGGLVFFIALTITGLIFSPFEIGITALFKLLISVISGIVGGIIGVNLRK